MNECKICKATMAPLFEARVLGKYDVVYKRCASCGFIQTDEPFWLGESYAQVINDIDIGPVNRAMTSVSLVEGVILDQFAGKGRFLDFGAGYGLFVRLMRDQGYDYSWYDAHCENLFAKHFAHRDGARYDLITAFEVFEHLVHPIEQIDKMLSMGRNVLFSTLLVPPGVERETDWWYFGSDHGQHIAFYTLPALRHLADRFNLHLVSDGSALHMLSERPMAEKAFRMFARNGYRSAVTRKLLRRRHHVGSLLGSDFHAVSGVSL